MTYNRLVDRYKQYPRQTKDGVIFFDRILKKPFFIPKEQLIKCNFCERYFRFINSKHLKTHHTYLREYKKEYEIPFTKTFAYKGTLEKFRKCINNIPKEKNTQGRERAYQLRKIRPFKVEYNAGSLKALKENVKKAKMPQMRKTRTKLLELIKTKHNLLQRRLRKQDFTVKEYGHIFALFHSIKLACSLAKLPKYPDKREWQKKSEEHKKAVMKKNTIKWAKLHPEKIKEYSKKQYKKTISSEEGKKRLKRNATKSYYKNVYKAKQCPTCDNKILAYSPRCKSCTMKIRMNKK